MFLCPVKLHELFRRLRGAPLSGNQVRMLLVVCELVNASEQRICYASASTLGWECNITARAARTVLDSLVEGGLLREESRPGESTVYTLTGYVPAAKTQPPRTRQPPSPAASGVPSPVASPPPIASGVPSPVASGDPPLLLHPTLPSGFTQVPDLVPKEEQREDTAPAESGEVDTSPPLESPNTTLSLFRERQQRAPEPAPTPPPPTPAPDDAAAARVKMNNHRTRAAVAYWHETVMPAMGLRPDPPLTQKERQTIRRSIEADADATFDAMQWVARGRDRWPREAKLSVTQVLEPARRADYARKWRSSQDPPTPPTPPPPQAPLERSQTQRLMSGELYQPVQDRPIEPPPPRRKP